MCSVHYPTLEEDKVSETEKPEEVEEETPSPVWPWAWAPTVEKVVEPVAEVVEEEVEVIEDAAMTLDDAVGRVMGMVQTARSTGLKAVTGRVFAGIDALLNGAGKDDKKP